MQPGTRRLFLARDVDGLSVTTTDAKGEAKQVYHLNSFVVLTYQPI